MLDNENNITQEITNSQGSSIVLNDQFINLLSELEQDLKRLKREHDESNDQKGEIKTHQNLEAYKNKAETPIEKGEKKNNQCLEEPKKERQESIEKVEDNQEIFLAYHLEELEALKEISTLSLISIEDITWFLKTAIFDLMSEIPEEFSIKPLALYECMLKKIESFSQKSDFLEHKNILLDLKNEENNKLFSLLLKKKEKDNKVDSLLEGKLKTEIERRKQNSVQSFFLALNARKRSLEECSSESNVTPSIKRIKLPMKISPLALPNTSLSNQIDSKDHENLSLQSGMKLF